MTDSVPVRELRDHLSRYLRRIRRGEALVITSRRRPVAKLTPIPEAGQPGLATLDSVEWEGGKPAGGRSRPRVTGKTASERILEDRG